MAGPSPPATSRNLRLPRSPSDCASASDGAAGGRTLPAIRQPPFFITRADPGVPWPVPGAYHALSAARSLQTGRSLHAADLLCWNALLKAHSGLHDFQIVRPTKM